MMMKPTAGVPGLIFQILIDIFKNSVFPNMELLIYPNQMRKEAVMIQMDAHFYFSFMSFIVKYFSLTFTFKKHYCGFILYF